ncbi:MAG: hypothetical protein E7L40_04840 [Corynebacterium kroppenstedtii]|uniref:ABC transporter domain-containing protein n=1 Tax=Corynebacterium kroppenstedtii TaxID=161879 RepID=A0A2W5U690_9CORY|nr:hypothetical protein [Corynebacterium kroppenstedtii]PZR04378.1 MAG: hypothetical protein DI525_07115 [Corynebacterium kroppenstedtii]
MAYIKAQSVSYTLADSWFLFRDVSFRTGSHEWVTVLGGNGTGKSRFIRLLAVSRDDSALDGVSVIDMQAGPVAHSGSVRLGARIRPGWFAQALGRPTWTQVGLNAASR